MVIAQGDIYWADLGVPIGSGPGYRRPVVVIQGDAANASGLATVLVVPLTTNLRWASAPGNVLLKAEGVGLSTDSIANISQTLSLDKSALEDRIGRVSRAVLRSLADGLDVLIGREHLI